MAATLGEAGWRAVNPAGPVDASTIPSLNASVLSTIPNSKLSTLAQSMYNVLLPVHLGMPIVASSDNVASGGSANIGSATTYASVTATVGSGGGLNVPRNLQYFLQFTNDSTAMMSDGGTVIFSGTNITGGTVSESVALSDVASAGSGAGLPGTAIFSSVGANYTVSSWQVGDDTASSKSITFEVGGGKLIGLPLSITATNAVLNAWVAGSAQIGTLTVNTGGLGTAALSFGNALDATDPVFASVWLTR
jgi:hypothetical protein